MLLYKLDNQDSNPIMRAYCHKVMPIYTLSNCDNTNRFFYASNAYNKYPVQNEVHQFNSETLGGKVTDNSRTDKFEDSMQFSTKTVNDDTVIRKIIANYPEMRDLMPQVYLAGVSSIEAEKTQISSMIKMLQPTMSRLFNLLHDEKLWKWVTRTWLDKKDFMSIATNQWRYDNMDQLRNMDDLIESIIPEFAKILIFENSEMSRKSKDWVTEENITEINHELKKRLSYVQSSIMDLFKYMTHEGVNWIKIDDVDQEIKPIFQKYEKKIADVYLYMLSALRKIYFPYDPTQFADNIDEDNFKFIESHLYQKTSEQKAQMEMFEHQIMDCVLHYQWLLFSEVVYALPDERIDDAKTFRKSTTTTLSEILTKVQEIITTATKYYLTQIKSLPTISPKCDTAKSEAIYRDYVYSFQEMIDESLDVQITQYWFDQFEKKETLEVKDERILDTNLIHEKLWVLRRTRFKKQFDTWNSKLIIILQRYASWQPIAMDLK